MAFLPYRSATRVIGRALKRPVLPQLLRSARGDGEELAFHPKRRSQLQAAGAHGMRDATSTIRGATMTMNDIYLTFPGGKRVEATVGKHHVVTDQTLSHGGDDSAPEPFELFLASLATCAGLYVVSFCQTRGIPTDQIELVQRHELDPNGQLSKVLLQLRLPRAFPEKYRAAVVRAAEGCKVRRSLASPPEVSVSAVVVPGHDDLGESGIA